MAVNKKENYRQQVADELIAALEKGTAPWQRPWNPGETKNPPYNPTTDKAYNGINNMVLELIATDKGYEDPRWLTYKQASEMGAQVRKGEKSTMIEYWKWSNTEKQYDEAGKPVLDEDGKQKTITTKLDRPRVFYANIFNASQIEGLPNYEPAPPKFKPIEKAEAVIASMDVEVRHVGSTAFYNPLGNVIRMPPKESFKDAYGYYATTLHELGHSTGHKDILARDLSGGFGSQSYAKEELRAEIASYMIAREIGIGHNPDNHASYVGSWIKELKNDKNEIFRAVRDAEIIKNYILEPEARPQLIERAQAAKAARETIKQEEKQVTDSKTETKPEATRNIEAKRNYLFVPFSEKDQAKALGARWDKQAKSWYAPNNVDAAALKQWAKPRTDNQSLKIDPVSSFANALKDQGLTLKGAPIMDGQNHRAMVEGDKKGQQSGAYRAYLDGVPNGMIYNYKQSDEPVKWVASAHDKDNHIDRAALNKQHEAVKAQRKIETQAAKAAATKAAYGIFTNAENAQPDHPYLQNKQVNAHGLKQTKDGKLIVPLTDKTGKLKNVQLIDQAGDKRFLKGGEKVGNFHMIGAVKKDQPLLIAEGYATAATLHETTGRPVAVAFDAGNLKPVGEAMRDLHPKSEIIFAADQDIKRERDNQKNVGMIKATEAVQAIKGARMIYPSFTEQDIDQKRTDFNDYANHYGKEQLKNQVEAVLKTPLNWSKQAAAEATTKVTAEVATKAPTKTKSKANTKDDEMVL
ncbi:MAG: zincin-like metallopeptidase domain-containing protein [Alphaproteobacteria bacterium]